MDFGKEFLGSKTEWHGLFLFARKENTVIHELQPRVDPLTLSLGLESRRMLEGGLWWITENRPADAAKRGGWTVDMVV